jgi:hypothetical protein
MMFFGLRAFATVSTCGVAGVPIAVGTGVVSELEGGVVASVRLTAGNVSCGAGGQAVNSKQRKDSSGKTILFMEARYGGCILIKVKGR